MALPNEEPYVFPEQLQRVRRDIRQAARTLTLQEVRYLVDLYYSVQAFRISSGNQVRALDEGEEPDSLLTWSMDAFRIVEDEVRKGLDIYSRYEPTGAGQWLRSIVGIGPVIAAGLLAHLDIERAPTAGHFWSFAGLNPTQVWNKGEKRPWNASLKVLTWKAGESFVKVQSNKHDVYGQLYVERKIAEQTRNEAGELAEQAAKILTAKRISHDTDAYKAYSTGKLPPAHIHARAKRWAVKLFLAHLHTVLYFLRYESLPPLPYPVVHLGHAHVIDVPNPDLVPGLVEALAARPRP